MFHEHDKFDTLTKTTVTLNAILAGDEILDFIRALITYGQIGFLYAMGFCILFIVCIHNVFVYVVSEAFKENSIKWEKDQRKLSKKSKSTIRDSKAVSALRPQSIVPGMNDLTEQTVVSKDVFEPQLVVQGDENLNFVKKKIYNKIIPQSRDQHIIEMNVKKSIIKDDIHYMKESMQNLASEDIGNFMVNVDEEMKASLIISGLLYVEFLLKRLKRLSRTLIDRE